MSGYVRGSGGVKKLPQNCFQAEYLGQVFSFCRQNALQRLALSAKLGEVLPLLAGFSLDPHELYALAYNCTLLWQVLDGEDSLESPCDPLYRFTLTQIADLARLYFEQSDLPFADGGFDEGGVNEGFDDALADL